MKHEHRAGNMILAKRLNESGLPVEAVVLKDVGYPEDASILQDASTIVIFCTGHGNHLLNPKLREFDALMRKGIGVIMIHWATEAVSGAPGDKFLEWMGGFCDLNWSVNPHWKPNFKPRMHPIWNGVQPFSVDDEWYYHMRFVEDRRGFTPILTDLPPPETLKRPDGPRSGNPAVRKAVANGETQHVAWAYERPWGGRGFGFTGGHNHVSWQDDNYRKIMLNAILWTAGMEVPKDGVQSSTPSDKEIESNLDPDPKKKKEIMNSFFDLGYFSLWVPCLAEELRPNILFCISDDQSYAHTGANGDPIVKTPAFDQVSREGIRFTHAFCDAPTCGPSRSAILTGQSIWRLEEAGNIHSTLPKSSSPTPRSLRMRDIPLALPARGGGPDAWRSAVGI